MKSLGRDNLDEKKNGNGLVKIKVKCCNMQKKKNGYDVEINAELVTLVRRNEEVMDELRVTIVYDGKDDGKLKNHMTWVCQCCKDELALDYSGKDMKKLTEQHIKNFDAELETRPTRAELTRSDSKRTKYRSLRDVDWGRHPRLHT